MQQGAGTRRLSDSGTKAGYNPLGSNGNGKGNATISGQPRTEGKTDSGNPAPDTEVDNDVESAASGSENALPAATARRGERDGTA